MEKWDFQWQKYENAISQLNPVIVLTIKRQEDRVIFACKAQIKILIALVSTHFEECQNFTWFEKYTGLNLWESIPSHSKV